MTAASIQRVVSSAGAWMKDGRNGPLSALYSLESDHTTRQLLSGVSCANSLCWSGDGRTLYFADMPSRRIDAFGYDVGSGALSNKRLFASVAAEPGLADGSIVDAEDCLWNAQWGGGKIMRYTPDGAIDREVRLPVSNPTCLAFGGPNLDILFVTTAWFGLNDTERAAQPHAGSIFAFRPGVRGRPENRYAG
jgi:L-arabinonolactonase